MTNVLPVQAQRTLWEMNRARFIIVLSLMLLVLALLALLALIPSFAALEANTLSPADANARGGTAAEGLRSMAKSQALLMAVSPIISSTSSPTTAIAKAIGLRPKGVVVQHIRYVGSSKQIILGGTAPREGITSYRDALENDPMFNSVSVPVAALVGASGQFSITLTGNY